MRANHGDAAAAALEEVMNSLTLNLPKEHHGVITINSDVCVKQLQ